MYTVYRARPPPVAPKIWGARPTAIHSGAVAHAIITEHLVHANASHDAAEETAHRLLYRCAMRDIRRRPTTNPVELEVKEVPLSLIKESDALRLRIPPYFGVDDLARDIQLRGQTTPLFVRPTADGHYELISGYCRRAALEQLKAPTGIVRIFRGLDDQEAYDLAINENQGRNSLSEIERANICLRLQQEGRTARQIAERMQWSGETSVFRYLRIAREAPPALREVLQNRQVSLNLALAFLDHAAKLSEEDQRRALAAACEHEMSAAEFNRLLLRLTGSDTTRPKSKERFRKLKQGGFMLNAMRVDPADPTIDDALTLLDAALKEARRLKRKVGSPDLVDEGDCR